MWIVKIAMLCLTWYPYKGIHFIFIILFYTQRRKSWYPKNRLMHHCVMNTIETTFTSNTGKNGVYIGILLLKQKECGYLLEQPQRGGSNEHPQYMFWAESLVNCSSF